jgi:hypothetical protein
MHQILWGVSVHVFLEKDEERAHQEDHNLDGSMKFMLLLQIMYKGVKKINLSSGSRITVFWM